MKAYFYQTYSFYFMCLLPTYMSVWCSRRSEEGIRLRGTGVTEGYELSCRSWELNLGPLQEQQMLERDEPSFQHIPPPKLEFKKKTWRREMAQKNTEDLSPVPGIHTVEGEN